MTEMTEEWAIEKVQGYGDDSDYVDLVYLATILLKLERRGEEIKKLQAKLKTVETELAIRKMPRYADRAMYV